MPILKFGWRSQQFFFGWFNLVLFVSIICLYIELPLVMQQYSWREFKIVLLHIAGLLAILRFLRVVPMNHYSYDKNNYGIWAIFRRFNEILTLFIPTHCDITHRCQTRTLLVFLPKHNLE